jgi:hypothetical protein
MPLHEVRLLKSIWPDFAFPFLPWMLFERK